MTNHKHSLEKFMNPSRNLPWLAGAVVACAVLAAPAARAQTITSTSATATSTAGGTGLKSQPVSQVGVVGGTVTPLPSTSAPEAITSTGTADFTYTVSVDPNGGSTVVEILYNLSKLLLKGKSGATYHTHGTGRITRILAASDLYEGTLPIWTTDAAGVTHYYTILARISSTFNTTTNVATGVSLALADYVIPATAGGVASGGAIQ